MASIRYMKHHECIEIVGVRFIFLLNFFRISDYNLKKCSKYGRFSSITFFMVEMGGNVCQVICSVFQGLSFEAMCNTWGAVTAALEKLCPQFPMGLV